MFTLENRSFCPSVLDHFADVGYQPEYGARELKRRIRTEPENQLAREVLGGKVAEGGALTATYDKAKRKTLFAQTKQKTEKKAAVK